MNEENFDTLTTEGKISALCKAANHNLHKIDTRINSLEFRLRVAFSITAGVILVGVVFTLKYLICLIK